MRTDGGNRAGPGAKPGTVGREGSPTLGAHAAAVQANAALGSRTKVRNGEKVVGQLARPK